MFEKATTGRTTRGGRRRERSVVVGGGGGGGGGGALLESDKPVTPPVTPPVESRIRATMTREERGEEDDDDDDERNALLLHNNNNNNSAEKRLPKWFSPMRLLHLFCLVAIALYLDRGVVSSAAVSGQPPGGSGGDENADDADGAASTSKGYGLQGDFDINYAEYGVLQSVFVIGLLVGAPVFSELSRSVNAFKLISLGLGACAIGDLGCALSPNFQFLLLMRVIVGVGEASFVALAAPFIDDHAPRGMKTRWLSYLYLCVPFGVALGIVYGGIVGTYFGWRFAFFGNALLLVPLFAFCATSDPIDLRKKTNTTNNNNAATNAEQQQVHQRQDKNIVEVFVYDSLKLLKIPTFLLTLSGFSWYSLVLGVFSAWGPKAGFALFEYELHTRSNADTALGILTVFCGVFGTLLGGIGVDYFAKKRKQHFQNQILERHGRGRRARVSSSSADSSVDSSVADNLYFSAFCSFFAFIFVVISFSSKNFYSFLFFLAVGESFAFMLQAPINAVVLWSVPTDSRPLACALCTVAVHVFGDVPSPPLFGYLLVKTNENWRWVMKLFTLCFAVAGVVFFVAGMIASASDRNDIFDREVRNDIDISNNSEGDVNDEREENDDENDVLI